MIDEIGRLEYLIKNTSFGLPYMIETWQDVLGINPAVWATATAGAGPGTVTWSIAEEPYHKVILAGAGNADDDARLYTVQQWQLAPDTWSPATFNKLLIMEWEAKIANVAEIDNAEFFMGLSEGALDTAASNHIAGIWLVGDAYYSITNDATGPTSKVLTGGVVANWSKFKILAYKDIVEFYYNEALINRHTTTDGEDLPDVNTHGQFFMPSEALGAGTGELHIATASIRPGVLL